ncbi:MAG: ankyrin repeat domain-containing protein [Acidobacteria bacterium]|nr:ankyrin repeat domain-containing protein [Acidobacteriota bacterium]
MRWIALTGLCALALYAWDLNDDLLAAARKGDAAAVKELLGKGANVNARSPYGVTPVHFASQNGHLEVLRILLENGADPNLRDTFYNFAPLARAADKGHVAVVKLLLDKGATGVDALLNSAVGSNNLDLVKVALEKGGLKKETLSIALANALRSNRKEIADALTKAGAVPPPKPDFQVDPAILQSYTGVYKAPLGFDMTITLKEGKLTAAPPGQDPLTLGALDPVTFQPLNFPGVTLKFKVSGGKATGISLTTPNGPVELSKAESK